MLELLAAIQSADPMSLALWAVIAFAAGMYPVGIMLGAQCSPCCCGCEEGQSLPDTITATFSGLTKSTVGTPLLSLSIAADFGSGAAGTVAGPTLGTGPIQSVSLTNGGSGYAKLNRIAPTLTASSTPGSGATFGVTAEKVDTKLFYWKITDITVSGGTSYQDGSPVTISLAEGDVEEVAVVATLATGREAPSLEAQNTSGTGAVMSVSVTANTGSSPATWGVDEVTVTDGGEDYDDGTPVTFTLGTGDVETKAATGYIKTTRVEPTLSADVQSSTGTGATVSITLDTTTDQDGRPLWFVAGLPVGDGGEGYVAGDEIPITLVEGIGGGSFTYGMVSAVDENGAITATLVVDGGLFFKDSGIIGSVVIDERGEYFHDTGVPQSVTVEDGGKYYHEDPTQPVLVADVTVTVNQTQPSSGSGAIITAVVSTDKNSSSFGKITALTLEDGGDGYTGFDYPECCASTLNGSTLCLTKSGNCTYTSNYCAFGVSVQYRGTATPPLVFIGGDCPVLLEADPGDSPFLCDGFNFTAVDLFGSGTVSVSSASETEDCGSYLPPGCCEKREPGLCTKQACAAAGYTWLEHCYSCGCGPCENQSLIVNIVAQCDPDPPNQGAGPDEYTLELTNENSYSVYSNNFDGNFPYVLNRGAYAYWNTEKCCLFVYATADDLVTGGGAYGYCTEPNWAGPPYVYQVPRAACIKIPHSGYCFVGGAEHGCENAPWKYSTCYSHVTVTLVEN